MGWKTIHGRRYYYRSKREGGRVRTEYLGGGEVGRLFARLDAEERAGREAIRAAERAEREADREQERALDDLVADAVRQAAEALRAAGYHQHKRQWRKRRGHRS